MTNLLITFPRDATDDERAALIAGLMLVEYTVMERRRQQERQELERQQDERASLVRKASAVTAIANIMVEQNEKMLAGLRAVAQSSGLGATSPVPASEA